jgi:outer membrane protein OmpA-like peptidoglycan-associated protein
MHSFKKCLVVLLLTPASAAAQTDAYATSSAAGGQIWKNPFGLCWRTSAWTREKAIAECDPDLVKKPAPVAAPAAAPAAPPPVVAAPPPPPPPPPPAAVVAAPAVPVAPAAPVVVPPPKPIPETVVLKGVNFATDSAQLAPGSTTTLDEAAAALIRRSEIKAEVAGHTDNRGAAQYNRTLSQRRAETVRSYLVSKGVDPARLTARGYGPDAPIADNGTQSGRAANRRVELRRVD